jgi:hypothetical protein
LFPYINENKLPAGYASFFGAIAGKWEIEIEPITSLQKRGNTAIAPPKYRSTLIEYDAPGGILAIGKVVKSDRPNCILLNRNYLHYFVEASPRACPRLLSLSRAYHLKVSFCNNSIAFVTSLDAVVALTSNATYSVGASPRACSWENGDRDECFARQI